MFLYVPFLHFLWPFGAKENSLILLPYDSHILTMLSTTFLSPCPTPQAVFLTRDIMFLNLLFSLQKATYSPTKASQLPNINPLVQVLLYLNCQLVSFIYFHNDDDFVRQFWPPGATGHLCKYIHKIKMLATELPDQSICVLFRKNVCILLPVSYLPVTSVQFCFQKTICKLFGNRVCVHAC